MYYFSKLNQLLFLLLPILILIIFPQLATSSNSNLFREYIGAEFKNVKFSDVPINPNTQFDFILSFAIDYTPSAKPTNGEFNVFWDSKTLSPLAVSSIKKKHPNVRVGVSLGGDSISNNPAYFNPTSIESWVSNAVSSLTRIFHQFDLDGLDIDYEHFLADPATFAECIGRLVLSLRRKGLVKYVSIAPFAEKEVEDHYLALWKRYGGVIDYVNFQFYAYENSTTVSEFLGYFKEQSEKYENGKILTSFISDGSKGLVPGKGFFKACRVLQERKQLYGIFAWCADDSKSLGFRHEKKAQSLLAAV